MTDKISEVERVIQEARSQADSVPNATKGLEDWIRVQSRATIGKLIVWGYLASLAVVFVYLLYRGIHLRESVFGDLIERLKIGVIPVVTFVIGHYFGAAQK